MSKDKIDEDICPDCGIVHGEDEESMFDSVGCLAESMLEESFPDVWKDCQEDIKDMGRKELAEEMFFAGAVNMLAKIMAMKFLEESLDSDNEDEEDDLEDNEKESIP